MSPRLLLLTSTALAGQLLLSAGCRTARDNQIDILERELRSQEDYIYELEDYVLEYSEKLRQCRCTQPTATAKQEQEPELALPPRTTTAKESLNAPPRPTELPKSDAAPRVDESEPTPATGPEDQSIEELDVPELELEIGEPVGSDTEIEATPLATAEQSSTTAIDQTGALAIPDPTTYQVAAIEESGETVEPVPETAQARAESESPEGSREGTLRAAERLIITHVFRDSAGDEPPGSLLSVIEARDGKNEPADFNGKVSLMVRTSDPESPRRIKRWDFTEEETRQAWQSSHLGDGLHLELPLESTPIPDEPCELWIRLETLDGNKLLAQTPIDVTRLLCIDDAGDEPLANENALGGGTQEAVAEETINPLRSSNGREMSPVKMITMEHDSSPMKSEPQWRAATHFSTGASSGFATTASHSAWTVSPLDKASRNRTGASASTSRDKQRWNAIKK